MHLQLNNFYSHLSKTVYLLFVFVIHIKTAFAQEDHNSEQFAIRVAHAQFKAKQVIPPTPEAASLGKYGNVPVSLFTGSPNIAVPLYTFPSSKISLPVTMNYSAQGFKPQDIATWVGLGWNLNAGGVITRSVIGNPDIIGNYYGQPVMPNAPSTQDMFAYYDIVKDMRDGRREDQPDVYYFNFGNYSGKFFIMRDGTVLKKTKDNLRVTNTFGDSYYITDEQGNAYYFNDAETTVTISGGMVELPDDVQPVYSSYGYTSSVYLSSIFSADGTESVSFEYYNATGHQQYNNAFQNQSVTYANKTVLDAGGGSCNAGGGTLTPQIRTSSAPITQSTRKYIKKISFTKNGVVTAYIDFISVNNVPTDRLDLNNNYMPGARRLDGIKIYSLNSNGSGFTLEKDYAFNYGYFTRQVNTTVNNEKLRLESITEKPVDATTTQKPPYQFIYNPIPNSGVSFETSIDHWGFYNGAGNASLIPNYYNGSGQTYGLGASREPEFGSTSATLLTKITYPTGGYSSFVYEQHQAKDENGIQMNVGGVRIKEITDYAFDTKKAITKKYFYTLADGATSGKCQRPNYVGSSSSYHKYPENCLCGSGVQNCAACCGMLSETETSSFTMSANAVTGLGSIQGSHIGYTMVTEKQTDVSNGQELGKTVYEYGFTQFQEKDDDIYNGSLLKQAVYNNGNKLMSETTNEYISGSTGAVVNWLFDASPNQDNKIKLCRYTENTNPYFTWRLVNHNSNLPCESSRIYKTKFSINGYLVFPQVKYLGKQTQKIYDQQTNSFITSVKEFTYGNSDHTLPTKIIQNTSGNQLVVTEKSYPLDYSAASGSDAPAAGIVSLKSANIVAAEIETVQYRQNPDGSNKRYVSGTLNMYNAGNPYPVQLYSLDIAQPLTSFQMSSIANTTGNFTYNSNYKLIGSFGYSAGNIVSQAKANDINTAYLWDYNNSQVTAQVINADLNMIAYTSFETDQTGQWSTVPNLITGRLGNGISGKFSYLLSGGNSITKTSLPATKTYIVSYWSKNGSLSVTSNSGASTMITGAVHNGWVYYEHTLAANSSSVTITSSYANIDELRLYPKNAQMTTMTYDGHNGSMISQCDANNSIATFEYDGYSRLTNVKDIDGNIIKNYQYNYGLGAPLTASAQTLFYNASTQSATLYKLGCPSGTYPSPVNYIVPYGKHASSISQADANAKAQADITANAQNYANQNSLCYYWNDEQSQVFYRNCQYWEGPPSSYLYTVPAHTFSSLINQADANQKALVDIQQNGQNNANMYGSCSCTAEGYRYVYGQCVQGQISYVGYVYEPGCSPGMNYRCYYYYYFPDGYQSPILEMCSSLPCQQF